MICCERQLHHRYVQWGFKGHEADTINSDCLKQAEGKK
jgi:hypothetical protein